MIKLLDSNAKIAQHICFPIVRAMCMPPESETPETLTRLN